MYWQMPFNHGLSEKKAVTICGTLKEAKAFAYHNQYCDSFGSVNKSGFVFSNMRKFRTLMNNTQKYTQNNNSS